MFDSSGVDSKTRDLRLAQEAAGPTGCNRNSDRDSVESAAPNSSGNSSIRRDSPRHIAHKPFSISLPLDLASCRLIRQEHCVNELEVKRDP